MSHPTVGWWDSAKPRCWGWPSCGGMPVWLHGCYKWLVLTWIEMSGSGCLQVKDQTEEKKNYILKKLGFDLCKDISKMSDRHSVLCQTFWLPVGHFAIWKCPANFVFSPGHFLHIDHCQTKRPAVLELSAEHFKIKPDVSGIFGDHWCLGRQ